MKVRKKPVVVEAVQFKINDPSSHETCREFAGERLTENDVGKWFVDTGDWFVPIFDGDYIIKGVNGEFYPCAPDVFEQTYEIMED